MSAQLLLLQVPKDGPSAYQRLQALKKAFGIWTHCCDSMLKKDNPWSALLVPHDCLYTDAACIELITNQCRLLEECNQLVVGQTEREAIKTLIRLNDLPIDL